MKGYTRRDSRRAARFTDMGEEARELWYHRIDQIRRGISRNVYRHHPLEEASVLIRRR